MSAQARLEAIHVETDRRVRPQPDGVRFDVEVAVQCQVGRQEVRAQMPQSLAHRRGDAATLAVRPEFGGDRFAGSNAGCQHEQRDQGLGRPRSQANVSIADAQFDAPEQVDTERWHAWCRAVDGRPMSVQGACPFHCLSPLLRDRCPAAPHCGAVHRSPTAFDDPCRGPPPATPRPRSTLERSPPGFPLASLGSTIGRDVVCPAAANRQARCRPADTLERQAVVERGTPLVRTPHSSWGHRPLHCDGRADRPHHLPVRPRPPSR